MQQQENLIFATQTKTIDMNKLLAITLFFGVTFTSLGQVQVPALSPEAEVEQTIGLTEVEVEYSRPSVRERAIFGDLLPYDKMWRTGANKNTIISFSSGVKINNQKLQAGEYAVFTKPGKESWMVYFYKDTENWGTPEEWEEDKVAAKLKLEVQKPSGLVETFTIQFDNVTTTSADLVFAWENTRLVMELMVPTDDLTQASIEETMAKDSISERDYYGAASYYLSAKKNMKEALTFIDKAIEMRGSEPFWYLRKKALIEYELGMKKQAIKTAKASMKGAKEAGNDGYVKMNQDSIKEWEAK